MLFTAVVFRMYVQSKKNRKKDTIKSFKVGGAKLENPPFQIVSHSDKEVYRVDIYLMTGFR